VGRSHGLRHGGDHGAPGLTPLPPAVYEWAVAPAAIALAFAHARRALGVARALVELAVLALYGFALEAVAMRVFRSHAYGAGWTLAPLGVPLAVAVVWSAVILSAVTLAARRGHTSPLRCGTVAALLGIAVDLAMEPVAVRTGLWRWTPPGPWLGVPVGNFVGWGVIVGGYTAGAQRFDRVASVPGRAFARVALGLVSIGALVLVGLAWRAAGAETSFAGAPGWIVWAALTTAAAVVALQPPRPSSASSFAERLAAAGGRAPSAVLLLLALAYGASALALGDPPVLVAACGAAIVCGTLLARA
jgi:hypothetical protein